MINIICKILRSFCWSLVLFFSEKLLLTSFLLIFSTKLNYISYNCNQYRFYLIRVFVLFQYGLYSAFLGCLVYVVFGSCKESSVGPTAIMAILIRENIHGLGPPFAILLCFLTGLVQLLMGFLQLGKILISMNIE